MLSPMNGPQQLAEKWKVFVLLGTIEEALVLNKDAEILYQVYK